MKLAHILLVVLFSTGMGVGQLLLKYSATRQTLTQDAPLFSRLFSLGTDWTFLLGAGLYAGLLVFWIWLLTFLPLSRAYPWTMLISLMVAATGGVLLFNEGVTMTFLIGLSLMAAGLVVMSL